MNIDRIEITENSVQLTIFPKEHKAIINDKDYFIKDEKIEPIMEKISTRKKELYQLMSIEKIENLSDYQKCRQAINSRNLINKNDSLGPYVYQSIGMSCFEANYTFNDNKYILSPIILVDSSTTEIDCTIIHELNHALEYHTIDVSHDGCTSYCGWDLSYTEFNSEKKQDKYTGITRKYELLNEYINDRIAQEITKIMYNQGNYILSRTGKNKESEYMVMGFLLEKFYTEFKNIIIESRSHGNINYLFENIGKDNFEDLNTLVNHFNNKIGLSFSAEKILEDYNRGIKNSKTLIIEEYLKSSNNIINNMRLYLQSKKIINKK